MRYYSKKTQTASHTPPGPPGPLHRSSSHHCRYPSRSCPCHRPVLQLNASAADREAKATHLAAHDGADGREPGLAIESCRRFVLRQRVDVVDFAFAIGRKEIHGFVELAESFDGVAKGLCAAFAFIASFEKGQRTLLPPASTRPTYTRAFGFEEK